jgi:hypothetical protein
VWVGYDVFDGLSWENRIPPDANDLTLAVRSDSGGDIWVLGGNNVFGDGSIVYGWNVSTWSTYRIWFPFDGFATTLAVGPDDSVWVGWEERYSLPYTNRTAGISRLPEEPGYVDLQQPLYVPGPVVSLLPTSEGMWGIGPGWLLQPDETVSFIEDVPRFEDVTEVVMTAEKQLFVHSVYQAPYTWGGIQTIDDQGTTRLNDDVWGYSTDLDILTAAEPVPDGDLWVAGYKYLRVGYPMGPLRYHQGGWLPYKEFFATDIFAEDARHTWFGYYEGVFRLDDGGTPSNYDDDVWTDYPTGSNRVKSAVAVDALGQLWYGSESGLYRYNGAAWEPVNLERAVCDMVPAADGTLFVQRAEDCSDLLDSSFNLVLIVRPDGGQEIKQVDELVEEEFDRVRTASHRNRLWTVAPDGAISYPLRRNSDLRIERYDGLILTSNHLPFHKSLYAGETLEIDEDNHLWLVGDRQLWRLSLPDFQLDQQFWLLVPGSSRQRTISVHAIAGYSGSVLLDVTGLPIGVTATFETNPVQAGEATQLTLTADAGVALGTNNATLGGTDGVITHTVPFTLKLVAVVYEFYAPLVTVYD